MWGSSCVQKKVEMQNISECLHLWKTAENSEIVFGFSIVPRFNASNIEIFDKFSEL